MVRSIRSGTVAAAMLLLGAATAAPGQDDVVVKVLGGNEANSSQATKSYNANTGGWSITLHALYNPGGDTRYDIYGSGGAIIDNLIIDVPCWKDSNGNCIPAGSPVFVRVLHGDEQGVKSVHNIHQTGDAETLLTHVFVKEDLGSVTAQAIGILEADRDILGPVVSITPDNWARGIGRATAHRDVRGDMIAMNGRVGIVEAGRFIGLANDPVEIRARHNSMMIFAEDAVYADISTRENGGEGRLTKLITPRFIGSINTKHLGYGWPNGEPALVQVTDLFVADVHIGHSHDNDDHNIELPSPPKGGLIGQIIINADNVAGASWSAPIKFGSDDDPNQIVLAGPGYDYSSDDLGGGAIGMAPFKLHEPSCHPQPGEEVILKPSDGALVVRVEHDGPITWEQGQPVIVERRPLADGSGIGSFQPMSQSNFTIMQPLNNPRAIIIDPINAEVGFTPGYEYRIQPTGNLVCDVNGLPNVIWSQPLLFTVDTEQETPEEPCPGDINDDGVVDVFDLIELINAWGPAGDNQPADLNGDGVVDVFDMIELINNWGPCEASGSSR